MILSAQDAGTNREGMSEDVADLDTKRTQAEGDTSAVTALRFLLYSNIYENLINLMLLKSNTRHLP